MAEEQDNKRPVVGLSGSWKYDPREREIALAKKESQSPSPLRRVIEKAKALFFLVHSYLTLPAVFIFPP